MESMVVTPKQENKIKPATYRFKHTSLNRDGGSTTVEINVDTSRLDVLVDEFAMFLRACGYTDDSIFKYINSEGEL